MSTKHTSRYSCFKSITKYKSIIDLVCEINSLKIILLEFYLSCMGIDLLWLSDQKVYLRIFLISEINLWNVDKINKKVQCKVHS